MYLLGNFEVDVIVKSSEPMHKGTIYPLPL